jgi:predicted KAP-like P-loop ATPase
MLHDSPIITKEKDKLHRYPLANRIAGMINRFNENESYVVGIEGQWGSGKTSFINLILEELQTSDAQIVKFNPWNFSDQNELIKDFFNSLVDSLKQNVGNEEEKIKKIKEYSSKLLKRSELTIAPELSFLGIKLKFGEVRKLLNEKPLEKQKESVNELLKELKRRIVIVIDDIDRLDADETKLVFKLVKITGNFFNTVFILAYDRGKVCERISEQGIKGEEYLKKIVQVSFGLPKPDPQDTFSIFFSDIDEIIKDFNKKYWDDVRWGNLFHSGFNKLFPTIRDIKRYINSLRLDLEIIGKDEVNPIDFIGVEAIRVFAADVFSAIADEKHTFTTTDNYLVGFDSRKEEERRKEICESVIKKAPNGLSEIIKGIIQQLFPQIKGIYSNTHYGHDWQQGWRQQLRICSEDIFDKYFSLSIPSTAISEKSVKDLLGTITNDRDFIENLITIQKDDKLRLILDRLLDHLDELKDEEKEKLLINVFDFTECIKDRKQGLFDLQDIDTLTLRLGYQTLRRVSKELRLNFLIKILHNTESIFSPIHLVSVLNQEIEKAEKKESQEECLLAKEEIDGIKKKCVEKIKTAADGNVLWKNKGFAFLLYRWKDWGSEVAVNEYIAEMLKTDDGLFNFLNGFVSESWSQSMDDMVAKKIKIIDKKAIVTFINIDELDKKVRNLDEAKLDEEKADLITLYKKPVKDRFQED